MYRVTLALALASSVSGLLLPAKIPAGNKVRSDCSGGIGTKVPARFGDVCSKPLSSALLPSTRSSRPLYMSIDPEALAQPIAFLSAGFSAGFLAGKNAAITQTDKQSSDIILPKVEELQTQVEELRAQVDELRAQPEPIPLNPVVIPPTDGDAERRSCRASAPATCCERVSRARATCSI